MNKKNILIAFVILVTILIMGSFLFYRSDRLVVPSATFNNGCNGATTTDCSKIPPYVPPVQPVATTSANPIPAGQIDAHLFVDNTLRDVNFCGNIYRVKQIIIDGVDVIQLIAKLATGDLIPWSVANGKVAESICMNVKAGNSSPEIDTPSLDKFSGKDFGIEGEVYSVNISSSRFFIFHTTGDVYAVGGFDGSLIGPIGSLK